MFDCCGEVYDDELINVREVYGDTYKIGIEDPCYKGTQCPWHYLIIGRKGTICPSGPAHLWVSYGKEGGPYDHNFSASDVKRYLNSIKAIRRR